jgi:hypothetical protein
MNNKHLNIDYLIEQKLDEINWKKAFSTAILGLGLATTPSNIFDKNTDVKLDPEYVSISDKRKVYQNKRKSGKYESKIIIEVIKKSVERGISPELVLAMLAQESTFGKDSQHNPLQIDTRYHPQLQAGYSIDDAFDIIEKTVFNDKYKKLSPAHRIQLYNGLTEKTKKDPKYGKNVINIAKNVIKKSPQLMHLIEKYKKYTLPGDELIK